jgi:hypothetical protein
MCSPESDATVPQLRCAVIDEDKRPDVYINRTPQSALEQLSYTASTAKAPAAMPGLLRDIWLMA